MLRYTGHPIADIGVATIAAFCEKLDPSTLSQEDLLKVAQFLEREYFSGKLLSYLRCVFFNSAYAQSNIGLEAIDRFKRQTLYAFQEPPAQEASGLRCTFSGGPASQVAYRQHAPLLTGVNVLNFFPAGTSGLPISGPYMLAIQAFPLGARRCYGRALAVHSPDDPSLTYAFAHRFLNENRRLLLLTEKSGEKYLDAKAPKTLIVHSLIEIEDERRDRNENKYDPSLTVYYLTSFGQKPDIDLFHLPSEVIRFLRLAVRAGTQQVWRRIEAVAWEKVASENQKRESKGRGRKGKSAKAEGEKSLTWGPGISRNYLYEDLFDLPKKAPYFVRTYFLRRAYRVARQQDDPRRAYRLSQELEIVSWELTRLFLKEVIGMEKARIEAIRTLGDRLADYIASDNDRRFFQRFYRTNQYGVLRNLLIQSCYARLRKGQPPLIGLDEFLLVFEDGEEVPRGDWRLARDLVLIRMIEELYKKGWFGKQPDVLEELDTDEEEGNGVAS
jgi:CRISPR-associated protein Cst1